MTSTLYFVIPWYGETIPGGAEAYCRSLVRALLSAGAAVEVLTTCVREFRSDWNDNHHAEGRSVECGVVVRRFRVRTRDTVRFDAVNYKLMHNQPVTAEEENIFVTEMINSPGLCDFIDAHQKDGVFLFVPYMFGTTYWGSSVCPSRSVLIPCLHDEAYARMEVFRRMCLSARGALFNSKAERRLADRMYGLEPERVAVIGAPVDCSLVADARRFCSKYGISDFFLYAGRTEQGKGADLLVEYFCRYLDETRRHEELVFIGGGELEIPQRYQSRIFRLGFLPVEDKNDAYGAALALCVPSTMESFSIVTMESWLAGRPVVVNARCEVTREFCEESNGGLYFADYGEFREILLLLARHRGLCRRMGANGREFVKQQFHPAAIAQKCLNALRGWGFD